MDLTDTAPPAVEAPPVASASDLLGTTPPAAPAAPPPAGVAPPVAGAAPPAAADAAWLEQVSADSADGKPSLRDWLKSTGVADLNALAKIARDNQTALRESGRIKVPGEGASADEMTAFRKAIGVPDDVAGYAVPQLKDDNGDPIELDAATVEAATASALKNGLPAAAFSAYLQEQAEREALQLATLQQEIQAEADAVVREWGAQAAEKTAQVQRGLEALGFTSDEALKIRAAIGPRSALDKFAKLGAGISEDAMVRGEGEVRRFGLSAADAQTTLATKQSDAAWASKAMVPGTAENAEFERLNAAIGSAEDRKQRFDV